MPWLDGTATPRVASQLETVFNVKSYGAVGNGTTDDTTAIQAALTAASSAGGGTVYVPKGVYRVGTLRINSYVTLRGAGPGASILRLKDNYVGDLLMTVNFETLTGTTPADAASGPTKFHLRDITLDGNGLGNDGAWTAQAKGWCMRVFAQSYTVDHVEFINGQMGGVYSEWRSVSGGTDMETFFSNFKVKDWGMGDALYPAVVTNGTGAASYGMYLNGPHDTVLTNGIVATLNSNIRPQSNPYSYGIYMLGSGYNMPSTSTPGGAAGEVFSNVHVWGRCHYGFYPHGGKMSCTGCVAEGAFIANVKLTTGTVWTGGEIYGNSGTYAAYYDEVGVQVGDTDLALGYNCSRAQVTNTFMTNFGATGRWFNFVQTAGNNRYVVNGHAGSATALYKGSVYLTGDDFDLVCHNNTTLTVKNTAWFHKFQYGLGLYLGGAPANPSDPALDFNKPTGTNMGGALWMDDTNKKFQGVYGDGYRGVRMRLDTEPQNLYGAGSPAGVVTAPRGSTWNRTDGGAGSSFYVKETGGVDSTGWVKSNVPNVFNAEAYGAVADSFYTDGVSNTSTTFTSATAAFTAGDVGKTIVILRAGPSNFQDHHTTISGFTNATTVTLTNATGRSQSACRFYVSRGGDSTTAIQNAINAAGLAGGGVVYLPGVGYLTTGVTLKNRVELRGAGMRATMLHLAGSSNVPVVANDLTANDSAMLCSVRDINIDGNRARQTDTTSTLGVAYTAGDATVTLASGTAFANAGSILIGTNRLNYTSKSGAVLSGVTGGQEGTTDANALINAGVTQHQCHGVAFQVVPYNAVPTTSESYDPHFLVSNVYVKNVKGNGIDLWGQSEARINNVWAHYPDHFGFRSSFDTWFTECTADTCGRAGYIMNSSEARAVHCKAFYCGGNVGSEGYGFLLTGPSTLEEGTKQLIGCDTQDNKANGYKLINAQRCIIQGTASSNGTASAGTYAGVDLAGVASLNVIDVICTERVASPNNAQQNALAIAVGCTNNRITLTHGATTGSVVGTAISSGSNLTGGGNEVRINGMGGMITDTFAAAPTPDPYLATQHLMVLTANVVVGVPANAHYGCPLVMMLKQDATGGRTIGWNAAFLNTPTSVTTANAYTIGRFVYDGSSWVGV